MAEKKKRTRKNVGKGIAHIRATFNNTMVTVTDMAGQVIAWDSAGTFGYKGSRKGTPFAAQRAGDRVADKLRKMGVHELEVRVKGPGSGRESAVSRPLTVGHRHQSHRGLHSASPQRLPPPQAA